MRSDPDSTFPADVDLSVWREKVRSDAGSFIQLCEKTGLCPDLWSLFEWSNWLTPISVGHKRFDTIFYVCCLEKQPKVVLDHSEVTTLKVGTSYLRQLYITQADSWPCVST